MVNFATTHGMALLAACGGVSIISVVLAITALSVAAKAKRRHRRRGTSVAPINDTETLEFLQQDITGLQDQIIQLQRDLADAQEALQTKVGTPKIVRFNAFGDTGSDLSFSLALLDDHQSGIVISSIYGREESRTYAKPISEGESSYPLTEEEVHVLTGTPLGDAEARRRRPVPTR